MQGSDLSELKKRVFEHEQSKQELELQNKKLEVTCKNWANLVKQKDELRLETGRLHKEILVSRRETTESQEARDAALAKLATSLEMRKRLAKDMQNLKQMELSAQERAEDWQSRYHDLEERTLMDQHNVPELKRQIAELQNANAKLAGHQNSNQRIKYMIKIKDENQRLTENLKRLSSKVKR
eukprot:TRINITY_DN4304_c0_g1_i1.p1 TRINITY_DN4304_c0_g1~~TRINITY_DN4304_c0_g1_i1.p1  ORF type:complete len:182 (+),score=45.88 TRINITY_DN4304_c0_g1_i1:452-997(+)